MNFIDWRDVMIIRRFDFRNLVRSAPGVIFLFIFMYLAVWGGGLALTLANIAPGIVDGALAFRAAILVFAKLIGHADAVPYLAKQPPLMSVFFIINLMVMPAWVILLSFSQIGGYIRRKTIRYVTPKTGRLELYLGLFLSVVTFFTVVWGAMTILMCLGFVLSVKGAGFGTVLTYALKIQVGLWLASVPLIAFMSLVSAMMGSPIGSVFVGIGAYLGSMVMGYFISRQTSYGEILYWVLPLEVKYWFLYGLPRFLAGMAITFGYLLGYLGLGWLVLRKRNL